MISLAEEDPEASYRVMAKSSLKAKGYSNYAKDILIAEDGNFESQKSLSRDRGNINLGSVASSI